ncbi:hypothetical protein BOTBODRAFT_29438 [Botryobasidium botryosum FD-172 SS1]|uniref:Calcineurin-like phosphoesterase domain-containing protein n=1 Tax=Botryobasidium botryosum (strain FD-172 SS1) TaxID=930990 RepID=A0A067MTS9_BOTB1|nr:hypothetical protein BOTBODRAFT_29438 [Botryobasidium botryosum FD-172 SS1]
MPSDKKASALFRIPVWRCVETQEQLPGILQGYFGIQRCNCNATFSPEMNPSDALPGVQPYRVHFEYTTPPPHPGSSWTRWVCISDTHGHTFTVPDGDVLVHAGDLTSWGKMNSLDSTIQWIKGLPHRTKILVAGNHDELLDSKLFEDGLNNIEATEDDLARAADLVKGPEALSSGIHYLEYESYEFQAKPGGRTWKVYGSPGSPQYSGGGFRYFQGKEADAINARIPADIDVLITHTPPEGTLDTLRNGSTHAGCGSLAIRVSRPDFTRCRLHVFGHIHEARGVTTVPVNCGEEIERVCANAAKSHRRADQPPVIVDLLDDI